MKKEEMYNVIIVLTVACLAAFIIFKSKWFVFAAAGLLLLSLFWEKAAYLIARAWKDFSLAIGNFNSRVLLFVIYYVFLTPIAYLFRLFNKDLVSNFTDRKRESLFKDVNKSYAKGLFEKMW